jgi:hypothetical protein
MLVEQVSVRQHGLPLPQLCSRSSHALCQPAAAAFEDTDFLLYVHVCLLCTKTMNTTLQADPSYLHDPHLRMAFASKLDAKSHEIQDKSIVLQTFYEGRIAALDRFVICFCNFNNNLT